MEKVYSISRAISSILNVGCLSAFESARSAELAQQMPGEVPDTKGNFCFRLPNELFIGAGLFTKSVCAAGATTFVSSRGPTSLYHNTVLEPKRLSASIAVARTLLSQSASRELDDFLLREIVNHLAPICWLKARRLLALLKPLLSSWPCARNSPPIARRLPEMKRLKNPQLVLPCVPCFLC